MFRRGHELGQHDPQWRYPSDLFLALPKAYL
jgi:hypothetical protein